MATRELRCVVLVCDGCATECVNTETEVNLHWPDAELARADMNELGWARENDRDLCPACQCALHGHDWFSMSPRPGTEHAWRFCRRCSEFERVLVVEENTS